MKAAMSSAGPGLDSGIDPRFGRCAYLIFYDTESGEWEAVPNANRDVGGGAGIRTAQLVIDRGAEAVVTGNIGPNAMQVLSGQVKVYTGFRGTVSEAVQAVKEGRLAETVSATVRDHAGLPGDPAAGGGSAGGPSPNAPGGTQGGMSMGGMPGPTGSPSGTWRGGRGRGGCGRGGGWGAGRWW